MKIIKELEPITKWFNKEQEKRFRLAFNVKGNNKTCPICGKPLTPQTSCNGEPLVKANVCCECDNRYVIPYRLMTVGYDLEQIERNAPNYFRLYMQGELTIEYKKKSGISS